MSTNSYVEVIDLKQLRSESLEMLRDAKTVFDEAGLVYWLDFGTLLGAVRHKRTLYWDGDFDLSTLDSEMLNRKDMWNKLRNKGYRVLLSDAGESEYVKVLLEKNKVGQFRVDLHRYKDTSQGTAEYVVQYKYKKLAQLFLKMRDMFSLSMPPGSEQYVASFKVPHFTGYHKICKAILDEGIPPEDLEKLGPIEYRHGKFNSNLDFELKNSRLNIKERPFASASRKAMLGISFFQACPHWVRKLGCLLCDLPIAAIPRTPEKKSVIPLEFLKKLGTVAFHEMEFNCPEPVDEYLRLTYGKNWRIPTHAWETDTDFEGQKVS